MIRGIVLWLAMMGGLVLWLGMRGAMSEEPLLEHYPETMVMPNTWDGPIMQLPDPSQTWTTFPAAGVSLGPHGEVKLDGKRDLDTTAKLFWNAVARVRGQPEPFPEEKP